MALGSRVGDEPVAEDQTKENEAGIGRKSEKNVKKIAVLDRTKEPGANGEPLYLDLRDLFYGAENAPMIIGGRYGGKFKESDKSIVNHEYREAVKNKIPVFALVENAVYSGHHHYLANIKQCKRYTLKLK